MALMRSKPRRTVDHFRPSNSHTLSLVAHQILPSAISAKQSGASGVDLSLEEKTRHFFSWYNPVACSLPSQKSPFCAVKNEPRLLANMGSAGGSGNGSKRAPS